MALGGVALAAVPLLRRLDVATERLVGAWKEGYQIPQAPEEPVERVVEALPPRVEEYVADFDPAGRAVYEYKARSLLDSGLDESRVLLELDKLRSRRAEVVTL